MAVLQKRLFGFPWCIFWGSVKQQNKYYVMSGVDFRDESPQTMPHKDNDNFIIKTILIHFYCLSLVSLNARPYKRQRFNHHLVEIKVIVSYCTVLF